MFEIAELGRTLPRKQFRKNMPVLRQELLDLQVELRDVKHSQVIVVFAGVDGAGKGETVNVLNEWMDPRWLITRAFDEPSAPERERPAFWRYWLSLPPRGRIGMYLSSWYSEPFMKRVFGSIGPREFDRRLEQIIGFEKALADDHAVIIKFWMHLSRDAQRERLQNLENDPLQRARVTERDWRHWELYEDFIAAAERVIMRTNTGHAPWHIVEGVDHAFRSLTVGTILRDTLRRRLEEIKLEVRRKVVSAPAGEQADPRSTRKRRRRKSAKTGSKARRSDPPASAGGAARVPAAVTVLSQLDMDSTLGRGDSSHQHGAGRA